MAKQNKPAIRFKGFTDAWEQRKLEDYLTVSAEKNTGNIYDRSDVLSVSGDYGIVNQIEFQGRSFAGASVSNYGVVQTGDVVYTKSPLNSNPYGIIKTNKGKTGIVSTLYAVYHPKGNAFSDFIQVYFEQHARMNNYMHPLVNKGAKNDMKVSAENALKGPVCFPSRIEQESISTFFSVLDNLITLHQRKYDKLQVLKKAMLEKMFPKNGCSVPEIRFKGFTDAWEQRKLATMCEKFTDGDWIEAKDQSDAGIRLVQTGNIGIAEYLDKPNNKKWISEETFERLHCEEVYPNDILISRLPEPAGRACIMPNLGTKMITAVDCTIVRPSKDVSANFLLQYLSSQSYFDEVNTCLAGGTRQRISRGNLAGFDVPIPLDKTEQDVIGNFLCTLDNLITLHQRELEKLQNIKKSMLEKMFV
jgi:type I restriction enzyme S subunit